MRSCLFSVLLFLSFTLSLPAFSQNQTAQWYFGQRAGLDFSKGSPVAVTNGMMATEEGCASIADENGKLLFYTNGVNVWNSRHLMMPNGFRLMGHRSSTQSAVIVPKPGSTTLYYIFTADLQSQLYGMRYSVVDMALNENTGQVTEKNIFITSPISEKITAIKHRNNRDVWVLVHKWNSDAYEAFLVTAAGVSKKPVISNVGPVHRGQSKGAIGCMKASPDGSKIAMALWRDFNRFEVFDFDNLNGLVSNRQAFENYPEAYGVEFSPDGSKLYGSTTGITSEPQLWQFNLKAGSKSAIQQSAMLIATSASDKIGALQLAPDGKIYLAREDEKYLGVIQNPNAPGWSCKYQDVGISLGDRKSKLGLPNFVQSFFVNLNAAR